VNDTMTLSQRADALEEKMSRELDYIVIKSRLYSMAEGDMSPAPNAGALMKDNPNARVLMGDDPRLPAMPEKPTLMDFFKYRFGPCMHLLQSARHAVKADLPEKMVLACLLHDISTIGFIRGDHGYWGAQLVEPYVDEEVTWAIRAHQVLRFYPDESVGYEYPQSYITSFGQEYRPDPYIEEDYKGCGTINGTCRADRLPYTTSTHSIPPCMSSSRNSPTSSAATSGSRSRGSAMTTARSRICGGP
jgi:hypothetical protein